MTSRTEVDIEQMRDQVFFEGPERQRRLSRYCLLLLLSAVIATAGVVSDSTATVIGAMIIAPLMTPILGVVLGVVTADRANLGRCLLLLAAGAAVVVALSWLLGHLVPYPVLAATNGQVAARVTPRLVDLVAALATGAVGSVALARPDISDTLPGVAIAISLVPPLAVAGLTLQSGAPGQCLGALLLFATNVVAILASGIVVMALYRAGRLPGPATAPAYRRPVAVVLIVVLLGAVLVPLWINSDRVDKTTIRQADVQAVADHWASDAGWSVIGVAATGNRVLVDATGPRPAPDLAVLRQDLDAAGLAGLDVRVSLVTARYQPLPEPAPPAAGNLSGCACACSPSPGAWPAADAACGSAWPRPGRGPQTSPPRSPACRPSRPADLPEQPRRPGRRTPGPVEPRSPGATVGQPGTAET